MGLWDHILDLGQRIEPLTGWRWASEHSAVVKASAHIIVSVNDSFPNDDLPPLGFQDQVALWLEVWTVDRPELRDEALAIADPDDDPWGYLAALGELILATG